MPGDVPANPFGFHQVGLGEQVADTPLCPWKWQVPEELFYVPVDNTENAYTDFKTAFSDPHASVTDGRLVTVTGDTGFGKTSLAHRCAHWLAGTGLPAKGAGGEIVDLQGEDVGSTLDERLKFVYELLVIRLEPRLNLGPQSQDLSAYADRPALGYAKLSDLLPRTVVAIVLLPSATITGELPKYLRLAETRRNFVFFAESGSADVGRECESVIPSSAAHVRLKVGKLNPDDAWHFTQARLKSHNPLGIKLDVTRNQLRAMLTQIPALNSMRTLQIFFFHVFQKAIVVGQQVISYDDMQMFWNGNSTLDLSR